jgi:lipoprotein-releasing system permease protein
MKAGLPFELLLGFRYLRSRGQRTNLSLFVWIGLGGVFLGVAALIVVLAVMTGFQDGIRDRIIAGSPHLLIFQGGSQGLDDADKVADRVKAIRGVHSATPFVHQQALFTTPNGGARGGLIRGVDLATAAVREDVRSQIRQGSVDPLADGEPAILLGRELARSLGVFPGDSVTVISPEGAVTAVGMVPKMRRYTVAGTIEIGMHEYDSSIAYLSLPNAKEFAGLTGATGIEVKLNDPFDAKNVSRVVSAQLGFRYWVRDWMEMNRSLFAALQLEKLALFVVVTIIVLVAAFAIIAVDHPRVFRGRHDHRRRGHRGRRGGGPQRDLGPEHLQGDQAGQRRVPDRSLADEADRERRAHGHRRHLDPVVPGDHHPGQAGGLARAGRCAPL